MLAEFGSSAGGQGVWLYTKYHVAVEGRRPNIGDRLDLKLDLMPMISFLIFVDLNKAVN